MVKRGREAVSRFCGWDELLAFTRKCKTPILAAFFATLFETGCRVSEGLELTPSMFVEGKEMITIYGVPVLKKGKPSFRNIPIPKHEKLAPLMMDWVNNCKFDYLFWDVNRIIKDGPRKFVNIPGVPSRHTTYNHLIKTDPAWWQHRIRSERATQLVIEYKYRVAHLMKFFNWSSPTEALKYVRLDILDIADKMVI